MASVGVDSFTLKMIEQMTGPMRAIEKQMERVAGGMEKLQKLGLAAFAGGAVIAGIKLMGSAISGLISIMGAGVGVAKSFIGSVMEAAKFRQQNLTALGVLLGKDQGAAAYEGALRVGGLTSANESDVVEQVRKLAAAGYKGGSLNRANAALLDVQALNGNEGMNELSYYFQKFKGGLGVEADDIRRSAQLAGVQERDLMHSALGIAGIAPTTGNDAALKKQVEGAKKAGKINGEVMVEALLQSIKGKLDEGGPLGSFALKMGSRTLAGLMSNLEEAPTTFLRKMKLEDLPGIKSLMEFIKRILVFFDMGTEQGQKLKGVIEGLINSLLGGLDNIDTKMLSRMFDMAAAAALKLVEAIKGAWDFVKLIIDGDIAGAFGKAMAGLVEVFKILGMALYEGFKAAAPSINDLNPLSDNLGRIMPKHAETASEAAARFLKGFGKQGATVNMGGVTVIGALNEAQAKESAARLTEALRAGNARSGGTPLPAPAAAGAQ